MREYKSRRTILVDEVCRKLVRLGVAHVVSTKSTKGFNTEFNACQILSEMGYDGRYIYKLLIRDIRKRVRFLFKHNLSKSQKLLVARALGKVS